MVSRVANGAVERAAGQLTVKTEHGDETLYQIPGCPANLASLPRLTGKGYKFYLQDGGPSLMIDPNLKAVVIPRAR